MMHYCNGACPMYDAENGECCATDGPRVSVKPDAECFFDAYELDNPFVPPKPTNADRIRSMSDEEMVKFLQEPFCDRRTGKECKETFCGNCDACMLDWLRQSAEEAHDGQTI